MKSANRILTVTMLLCLTLVVCAQLPQEQSPQAGQPMNQDDTDPNKRDKLIDSLIGSEAFTDQ